MVDQITKTIHQMREAAHGVRYRDLFAVCVAHFGPPRQSGSSHAVFRTPWAGDPGVNIQSHKGQAKAYQIRQVLQAIDRLQEETQRD